MSAKGLEPLTNGLKGHCSTIELRAHVKKAILSRPHFNVNGELQTGTALRVLLVFGCRGGFGEGCSGFRSGACSAPDRTGSVLRVEEGGQVIQCVQVIFTITAHIADPGREIGHGDHAVFQKSKPGYRCLAHLADSAVAAGDHVERFLKFSHLVHFPLIFKL